MIYFDNAATGGFKSNAALNAALSSMRFLCANPGRSGHRLSLAGASIVYQTRETLRDFFGGENAERVIFTKNCTEALNLAIFGLLQQGDHVIVSEAEHNSVLRPLFYLKNKGVITLTVLPVKRFYAVTAQDVAAALTPKTKLCCLSHAANVTGEGINLTEISKVLKPRGVFFLLDAAQTAGHVKIHMTKDGIDILAVAGHKGMGAIPGSGVLIFGENLTLRPLLFGGTGSAGLSTEQPTQYPDALESGTLNLPAISSLNEAARFLSRYMDSFGETLKKSTARLCEALSAFPEITLYSKPNPVGIVSFAVSDFPSQEVADALSERFDIAVRGGYHCAPLLHKALHTEDEGLVRVSLSPQNTRGEELQFLRAMHILIDERK